MKDANKILTKAWVAEKTKEAETEFKKWDKSKQKKWAAGSDGPY